MASYTPPTENLPIFDNSVFNAVNDSTILTVSIANLLYLRKTYADTATALETFNAGIATNTIQATNSTTGSITIGASQTDGILNLGTGSRTATGVINIATGSGAGNVNILTGVGTSGGLNIGTATSGTNTVPVSINTGNQSGAINMGNAGNTFQVNSGTINIGTIPTSCQVVLLGQDAALGSVKLATGSGVNTASVSISTGTTTGDVTIGNSSNAVKVNGAVTLAKPLILGTAPTANTQIGFLQSNTLSTFTATGNYTLSSLTLPAGVYLLNLNVQMNFSISPTILLFNFTGSGVDTLNFLGNLRPTSTYSFFCTASQVVNTTASSYTVFVTNSSGTATSVSGVFQAVRIG
jgi:hypothetical protein